MSRATRLAAIVLIAVAATTGLSRTAEATTVTPTNPSAEAAQPGTSHNPIEKEFTYGWTITITMRDGTRTTKKTIGVAQTQRMVSPDSAGPTGQTLKCNYAYFFTDASGTYTIQHNCNSGIAGASGWSYKINAGLCASAQGYVYEGGMGWSRKGYT